MPAAQHRATGMFPGAPSERFDTVTAIGLGTVHGLIRALHQAVQAFTGTVFGNAKAGTLVLHPLEGKSVDTFLQGMHRALGAGSIRLRQDDQKLLATKPANLVHHTHAITQQPGELPQHTVPHSSP